MAVIDTDRDVLIVRIVYTGLASVGKTASIEALSEILTRKEPNVFSIEKGFRNTLDFDWLEHTGGFFQGRPITSQIIAIPSKLATGQRNPLLLKSDVVIFVWDSDREKKIENFKYFKRLQNILAQKDEPVGIVIQANKQDQENALSSDEISVLFQHYPDVKIAASTATEHKGVREAFVLAVHLAVKQVNQLKANNKLKIGQVKIKNGEDLLAFVQEFPDVDEEQEIDDVDIEQEIEALTKVEESPKIEETLEFTEESDESKEIQVIASDNLPQIPDKNTATKWIWPPFSGRRLLKEFLSHTLEYSEQADGRQTLRAKNEWLAFSKPEWKYNDIQAVKQALREHSRLHLQCSSVLSEQRCIAILPENQNQWRLWQILRTEATLSDQLRAALQAREINVILLETFRCASRYIEIYQRCSQFSPTLSLNLDNIGVDQDKRLIYLGHIEKASQAQTHSNADILIDTLKRLFVAPIVKALQHTDIKAEIIFNSTLSVLASPFKRKKIGKSKKN